LYIIHIIVAMSRLLLVLCSLDSSQNKYYK